MMKDSFFTISKPFEAPVYKEKQSKFFAYAFPFTDENQLSHNLELLKAQHKNAGHFCYAYRIGFRGDKFRVDDNGEPRNSAGMPIYGQIKAFELTNVLIVVVRYFGGVKLGVSGLVNAYKTAAKMAIEDSRIIEDTLKAYFQLIFDYKDMSKVMYLLKKNGAQIYKQELKDKCLLEISVRKGNSSKLIEIFKPFYGVQLNEL